MITKKILFASLLLLSSISFFSCGDDNDNDTTGPAITLNKPTDESSFSRGDVIALEFDLEDESGINQYKVDIHWGGDHTHKGTKAESEEHIQWSYQQVYSDKKGEKKAHIHINTELIPENAEGGHYHLGIIATDLAGNESKKYIEIEIEEEASAH